MHENVRPPQKRSFPEKILRCSSGRQVLMSEGETCPCRVVSHLPTSLLVLFQMGNNSGLPNALYLVPSVLCSLEVLTTAKRERSLRKKISKNKRRNAYHLIAFFSTLPFRLQQQH